MTALGPLMGAAAVIVGILVGGRAGPGAATPLLALGGGLVFVALRTRWTLRTRGALVLCALAAVACASMQRALDGLEHSELTDAVEWRRPGTITAVLVTDPRTQPYSAQVRVRVERAEVDGEHLSPSRVVMVRGSGGVAMRLGLLEAGDRVTLAGQFQPLEGWDTRERWNHAVGAFRADTFVRFAEPSNPVWRLANSLRHRVLAGLDPLPTTERALAASYLLGDDRGLPAETVDDFRAAGMTHLLVVSGSNVAFALALFGPVLRRLGLRSRFVGGVTVLVVFGTMTRWEPSVLRAIVMSGLVMTAVLAGRPAAGVRVLGLAVIVILIADPFLAHSVTFQLSCAATFGIAVLSNRLARWLRGPRWWREAFATTLAAQIGVTPVLVAVFGTIPLASIPANIAAAPPVGFVTVAGLVGGLGGGLVAPVLPGLATLAPVPAGAVLAYERTVASAAARIPLSLDGRGVVLVTVAVGLVAAVLRTRRLRTDAHPDPR